MAAQFCFFAHSPEELREPELAQLQSPSEQRRAEGTPQQIYVSIDVAANTASNDQVHCMALMLWSPIHVLFLQGCLHSGRLHALMVLVPSQLTSVKVAVKHD